MSLLTIVLIIVALLLSGIRVAQEYERAIVFRLGRFVGTRGPGLYWIIPFIERQQTIDIRTKTVDLEQQETITKDSVTIKVNAVLWFRVVNPADAIIKVANFNQAVYQLSVTALRNIIGQHQLDEMLRERQQINAALLQIVDAATENWGVSVELVEIKDVEIPESMQRAMAREAEAIREKRARIIKAEAELEASIKLTQGAKQMEESPIALELRRMQMLSEIGIDNNTTTVVLIPSEFTNAAKSFTQMVTQDKAE
ncbi:slipin family protein [Hymenobacter properus]|uniref:Slipin family protein n=1 Tax=Hymenobacter properus TaxID=2791026 RepID=A0A931BKX1_9BACT|nr:slipin family protein [Hymenobacter properus]MBF9144182.1 slipin family protein [Hymenobacter properus]MBR7722999.1 slipin family protein [Microvirga sp. SRT04]